MIGIKAESFAEAEPHPNSIDHNGKVVVDDDDDDERWRRQRGCRSRLIAENEKQATQYRAGKTKLLGFFVGQVMKETRGQADPADVNRLVKAALEQAV